METTQITYFLVNKLNFKKFCIALVLLSTYFPYIYLKLSINQLISDINLSISYNILLLSFLYRLGLKYSILHK